MLFQINRNSIYFKYATNNFDWYESLTEAIERAKWGTDPTNTRLGFLHQRAATKWSELTIPNKHLIFYSHRT